MRDPAFNATISPDDWGYRYVADVNKFHDGDTTLVDIDLGFDIWAENIWIRHDGYNAPEITGTQKEQGLLALGYWQNLTMESGGLIYLQTEKVVIRSLTRYVADVYVSVDGALKSVNALMRAAGFHVPRVKGKTLSLPETSATNLEYGDFLESGVSQYLDEYVNERMS
jgi:hypothetical protein